MVIEGERVVVGDADADERADAGSATRCSAAGTTGAGSRGAGAGPTPPRRSADARPRLAESGPTADDPLPPIGRRRAAAVLARPSPCSSTSAGGSAPTGPRSTSPATSPARRTSTWTPTSPRPPGAGGRHPLPDPDRFARGDAPGRRRGDRPVVVYDDWAGTAATPGLVAAALPRAPRRAACSTAAGRWWRAARRRCETGEGPRGRRATSGAARGMPVVDADGAARWRRDGVLLDARAAERFRGEVEPVDPVAGHVPGAVNLPTAREPRRRPVPAAGRAGARSTRDVDGRGARSRRTAARGVDRHPRPCSRCTCSAGAALYPAAGAAGSPTRATGGYRGVTVARSVGVLPGARPSAQGRHQACYQCTPLSSLASISCCGVVSSVVGALGGRGVGEHLVGQVQHPEGRPWAPGCAPRAPRLPSAVLISCGRSTIAAIDHVGGLRGRDRRELVVDLRRRDHRRAHQRHVDRGEADPVADQLGGRPRCSRRPAPPSTRRRR